MLPDVVSHSILICVCEKASQPEHAMHIFHGMEQKELVPDGIAYNALASACEKDKPEWVPAVFDRMQQQGLVPDVMICNSLIIAWGKTQQFEQGIQLFHSMNQRNILPNPVTYSNLLRACE